MSAYVIFDVRDVTDPAALDDYVGAVTATVTAYHGRYVVRGGEVQILEGDWKPNLLVLIEFPDVAAANTWYESADYRPLRDQRHACARCDAVVVAGTEPT